MAMSQLISDCITSSSSVCFLLVATTFFFLLARKLVWQGGHGGPGTRRGLSIHVTDRAVAHRALVEHSAAFLNRPIGVTPTSILTGDRHYNIVSAPYGPYWRTLRRNMTAGVLHPSSLGIHADTRARVLDQLLRGLRSGAPAAETIYFSVYSLLAEMCFGEEIVSELEETCLRDMHNLQHDMLFALPSFGVLVRYPRMSKLLYPSRWRQVLALRRQLAQYFMPLVAEVKKKKKKEEDPSGFTRTYVESLLDLQIPQEDGGSRALTDGELVSLISEFLGAGTNTTASTLQWTMANLIKRPDMQEKLRVELDAVTCSQRFIEEAELSRMPYLKATVLESLRRHPPIPFVLRHTGPEVASKLLGLNSVPDRGATLNFLVGKIGRDAVAWPDPMEFKPERFMDGRNIDLTCTRELRMMPFGAGRRACPAIVPAMLHIEYFLANLVKEFEWREADGDNEAIDLTEFHGIFITIMNRPLRARLVPREAK